MNMKEAMAAGAAKERKRILKFLETRVDPYDDPYGAQQSIINSVMDDIKSGYHIYSLTERAKNWLCETRRRRRARRRKKK